MPSKPEKYTPTNNKGLNIYRNKGIIPIQQKRNPLFKYSPRTTPPNKLIN